MDARLQRRIQRYGWDLAADNYQPLWQTQLAEAQAAMIAWASLAPGKRVLFPIVDAESGALGIVLGFPANLSSQRQLHRGI
jgi:hypothetical protein